MKFEKKGGEETRSRAKKIFPHGYFSPPGVLVEFGHWTPPNSPIKQFPIGFPPLLLGISIKDKTLIQAHHWLEGDVAVLFEGGLALLLCSRPVFTKMAFITISLGNSCFVALNYL